MDLTALPASPEVSTVSFRGSTFYAKMTNTFRLVTLPSEPTAASKLSVATPQLYCRIPQALSQDEYREVLKRDVLDNSVRILRTQSGIHDVLAALDCFDGDGDSTYRQPPTHYRYCPHGKFTRLSESEQTRGHDDMADTPTFTSRDTETPVDDDDEDAASFLGSYNATAFPQWNIELEQWELHLAPGGRCGNEGERQTAKLVFRCHPPRSSGKTTWLVYHERNSCEYTIEMETSAVCDWYTAIANIYKCPIPCLSV